MKYNTRVLQILFDHDFFRCGSCGYVTRIRVLGNTCRCPQCGGTMTRT